MPASYAGDISAWVRDIEKSLEGFNRGARKSILRKGAAIVRKDAKDITPTRNPKQKSGIGLKPNPYYSRSASGKRRGKGKGIIKAWYYKGNLKRSIATLSFRRSNDAFVGPRFLKQTSVYVGWTIGTANGYYAGMVYGGKRQFRSRVLEPALSKNRAKVLSIIASESRAKITGEFRKRRP